MQGRRIIYSLFVIICLFCFSFAETENKDISKLSVKELKKILSDRGIECTDCVEKGHYVEKVKEVIHLPVVPPKEKPKVEPKQEQKAEKAPDLSYEEIMKMFKKQEEEKKQTWEKLKEKGIDIEQLQRNLNKGKIPEFKNPPHHPRKGEEETVEKEL